MSRIVTLNLPPDPIPKEVAIAVNQILKGKTNNTSAVTLTANAGTTALADVRIGVESCIVLQPQTANAAAALSTTYLDTPGDGTVTINHANNAQTDKTFKYAVIG